MSQEQFKCPVCDNDAKKTTLENTYRIDCSFCGEYNIGDASYIPNLTEEEKIKLRYLYAILDKKDERRVKYWITNDNKKDFLNKIDSPPNLINKISLILESLNEKTRYFAHEIPVYAAKEYPRFFCRDAKELVQILEHLKEDGAIKFNSTLIRHAEQEMPPYKIQLTATGIKKAEELTQKTKSDQCFVAMWFSGKTENAYSEAMEKAIGEDSGYESYKVSNNDQNNGWIPDTIVKEIRRSKFVIADLTGYRAGVYYEAGFAEGLGKEVIYTCNKNWFDEQEEMMKIPIQCSNCSGTNELKLDGVHFNLKQRKMILWEEDNLPDFRKALAERIGAVIGINEKKKT